MIQGFMQNQEREKKESTKKVESKKVDEEEHKKRLEKLKGLGLLKKD